MKVSWTIPTSTIIETSVCITVTVNLKMLGYKIHRQKEQQHPLKKLEAKIKAARRQASQLSEQQTGVMKKGVPEK